MLLLITDVGALNGLQANALLQQAVRRIYIQFKMALIQFVTVKFRGYILTNLNASFSPIIAAFADLILNMFIGAQHDI